jgi:hypothetical protein
MLSFQIQNGFNELDFIFDSETCIVLSEIKNVFSEITRKWFDGNLIFAIIETVTISEVSSIGTTEYISYKSVDEIKNNIHKEYLEIIDTIQGTEFGGPSKYYDWYRREEFYYAFGLNLDAKPIKPIILNSIKIEPEPKPDSKQYISDYDKVLTDSEIRQFYDNYITCLLSKEWFKELPHYFILVKPISIKDKESNLFIPLGNLYLKVGTNTKVNLNDYKKYVNYLKSVWFNKYGDKILKEYSEKKISDEYKPKIMGSKPLENKLNKTLFKVGGKDKTLNDFYYYAFDFENYAILKEEHLFKSDSLFIKKLIASHNNKSSISELIKNTYDRKDDRLNVLNKAATGLEAFKSIDLPEIKYFLLLLSKRRLALLLLLVFGFTVSETHNTLSFGEREPKKKPKAKSHTDFLGTQLFIFNPNRPSKLIEQLADKDKSFLTEIAKVIKKAHPEFESSFLN